MIRGERCKDMNDHLSYVQQHARGHLSSHAWQPGGGGGKSREEGGAVGLVWASVFGEFLASESLKQFWNF